MTDEEVEVVARAIAKARQSRPSQSDVQPLITVLEQHRELARLAIVTLEAHRAARQAHQDDVPPETTCLSKA